MKGSQLDDLWNKATSRVTPSEWDQIDCLIDAGSAGLVHIKNLYFDHVNGFLVFVPEVPLTLTDPTDLDEEIRLHQRESAALNEIVAEWPTRYDPPGRPT